MVIAFDADMKLALWVPDPEGSEKRVWLQAAAVLSSELSVANTQFSLLLWESGGKHPIPVCLQWGWKVPPGSHPRAFPLGLALNFLVPGGFGCL